MTSIFTPVVSSDWRGRVEEAMPAPEPLTPDEEAAGRRFVSMFVPTSCFIPQTVYVIGLLSLMAPMWIRWGRYYETWTDVEEDVSSDPQFARCRERWRKFYLCKLVHRYFNDPIFAKDFTEELKKMFDAADLSLFEHRKAYRHGNFGDFRNGPYERRA
jgi:hypothetical protein